MSILLSLVFFTLLLVLGFGLNGWSLAAIIIGFTIGLSFLMAGIDIESIKENWGNRRCEFDILLTSFLYKPTSDTRTVNDFMNENFEFCTRQTIQDFLKVLLTPLYTVLGKQLDVANGLSETMNMFRTMRANMMESFQKIFDPIFERFLHTGIAFSQNFQRMLSAMKRIGGIAVSTLYLGMSLQVSIENFVKFVIRIVMIIMGILISMFILLFFALFPVLPVILGTVAALAAAGIGVAGAGVFCFDPHTKVKLQDGTVKCIDRLTLGEKLEDGGEVEGVLRSTTSGEQMYSLYGIIVSGSHLVWSEESQDWIQVKDSTLANPVFQKPAHLVCLRTSTRNIVLRDIYGTQHVFRDWEELPLNIPEADTIWNYLVGKILATKDSQTPQDDPLCGPRCCVLLQTGERVPISMIRIGDSIYSQDGFTKVVGIYEGHSNLLSSYSLSDGVWVQNKESWSHPQMKQGSLQRGFHLVTLSGTFWIQSENHSGFIRDFTEVGLDNLPLTYSFTHALLKKSLRKEEICEPVSLSQVFLSYSQPIF
jgi:hypothetical protein